MTFEEVTKIAAYPSNANAAIYHDSWRAPNVRYFPVITGGRNYRYSLLANSFDQDADPAGCYITDGEKFYPCEGLRLIYIQFPAGRHIQWAEGWNILYLNDRPKLDQNKTTYLYVQ